MIDVLKMITAKLLTFLSTFFIIAPEIGFNPDSYTYDEAAGVARLTITTNRPARFTNATGALFYTEDVTATGGGGIATGVYSRILNSLPCMAD